MEDEVASSKNENRELVALTPFKDVPGTFTPQDIRTWERLNSQDLIMWGTKRDNPTRLLEIEGFLFGKPHVTKRKKTPGLHINWTCLETNCGGTAYSFRHTEDAPDSNVRIVKNHITFGPNRCKARENHAVLRNKAIQLIKSMCLEDGDTFSQALTTVQRMFTLYDRSLATNLRLGTLEKIISKLRHENTQPMPSKTSHDPIVFNALSRKDLRDRPFLIRNHQYIESDGKPGRIVVFGTIAFLKHMFSRTRIFADGTFTMTPKPFSQHFSIHGFIGDECVPFLYVFLSHKTKRIYTKLFQWLKTVAIHLNQPIQWTSITCDFESGLLASIKEVFQAPGMQPQLSVVGCYFHFTQALYGKIVDVGLKSEYGSNAYFRAYIHRIMTLAYVPVEHLQEVHASIAVPVLEGILAQKLVLFQTYFRECWLHPQNARFLPTTWNLFAVSDNHRTNNHLEAWHRVLRKKCGTHQGFWYVLGALKREQLDREVVVDKQLIGVRSSRPISFEDKRKYGGINRLREMLSAGEITALVYFTGIYFLIH